MIDKVAKLIEENDTIVIFSHAYPDGDAYGSQIGLRQLLRATYPNKKIYAVGSGLKNFFDLIGEMDEVEDEVVKQSLVFLLDANEFDRFEDPRSKEGKYKILIDHHIQNNFEGFDVRVVNEIACSTCEIVVNLARELKLQFTKEAANALFLGLLTDSGRFQFAKDYSSMFSTASFLIKEGAEPSGLYKILNVVKEKDLLIRSFIFSKLKRFKEGLLFVYFSYRDIKRLKISSSNKAANFVNMIGNIENYPIWIIAAQDEENNVKFEFRSNKYPVQPIALKYGGGGHELAAGLTIKNCKKEQIQAVIADYLELLRGN